MPCDPYTEAGYFETIRRMAEAVKNDAAELVLMGIRPTYPSAQYGYVVPVPGNDESGIYRVSRFTEKPDVPTAGRLISEGAFWNGGVFAFRLGYMTDPFPLRGVPENQFRLRGRREGAVGRSRAFCRRVERPRHMEHAD